MLIVDLIPELKARFLPFLFLKSWFDQSDSFQIKQSKQKKSIRRRQLRTNRRAGPEGIRNSKVSRFIQETRIFQKRKYFNVSDSCLMALMACLIGCLLPLLDPHTPINTRASGTLQRTEKHTEKIEKRKKQRIWRYAAHNPTKVVNIFKSNLSQSSHSANISTPSATDHTSLIGKGL